jgi:hypothetical protein
VSAYDDRPVFIDPVLDSVGEELGDGRVPRWFALVAALLLGTAVYYLVAFGDGPRLTSRHNFGPGHATWLEQTTGEVAGEHSAP